MLDELVKERFWMCKTVLFDLLFKFSQTAADVAGSLACW